MSIQMIGIDHTKASIDVRTVFPLRRKQLAKLWKNGKKNRRLQDVLYYPPAIVWRFGSVQ